MKPSEEELERGRQRVAASDIDGVMEWVIKNDPYCDRDLFRTTFQRCFAAGDVDKALRLFNFTFPDYDPDLQRAKHVLLRVGCVGFVLLIGLIVSALTYLVFFK